MYVYKHSVHVHYVTLACYMAVLSSCTHKSRLITKKVFVSKNKKTAIIPSFSKENPPPITVWIHGTKLIHYPLFHRIFNGKPGLKHASEFPGERKIYNRMQALSIQAPNLFPYETLYFFGWSGKLSVKEREEVAQTLYNKLHDLRIGYQMYYGVEPKINLVCHSHGGNLALRLAQISTQTKNPIHIDSLIVLACPVQLSTQDFVRHNIFKKVYAFYSTLDFVQVIAPELCHHIHNEHGKVIRKKARWFPFSSRMFPKDTRVRQARIKVNHHAIFHTRFTSVSFLRALPELIYALDTVYEEHGKAIVRNCKEVLLSLDTHKKKDPIALA